MLDCETISTAFVTLSYSWNVPQSSFPLRPIALFLHTASEMFMCILPIGFEATTGGQYTCRTRDAKSEPSELAHFAWNWNWSWSILLGAGAGAVKNGQLRPRKRDVFTKQSKIKQN